MNRKLDRSTRHGMTLMELVVSMGLLAMIMLPVIGLLGTTYKVYNSSSERYNGSYARQTALDTTAMLLSGASDATTASNRVDVRFENGTSGRLSYSRGQLIWNFAGTSQVLVNGLTRARFTLGAAPGASPTAGELLLLEVASQSREEPVETWSSTRIWIRPTI